MSFAQIVVKNLLRRKGRSILTAAGVAASVAATVGLLSIAWGYAASAVDSYASRGVDIVVVRAGIAERITSSLSASLASRLEALPEVAEVEGTLTEMVSLGGHSLIGVPLRGLDSTGFAMKHLHLQSGRELPAGGRRLVLLGAGLARSLQKQTGEMTQIEGVPFEVGGVFESDNALEAHTAIAGLTDVQELMGRRQQVSEFQVRIRPNVAKSPDVRGLCRTIEALRDERERPLGLKAMPTRQFVDSGTETRLAAAMAWGTSVIAGVLSSAGMLNTMLMSVLERTRELGILRAVGWSRRRIVSLIVGEGIAISLVSSIVGTLAAWTVVRSLAAWSITRNFVPPGLSPFALLIGIGCALTAGLAGSFWPAYRGATICPTDALRAE